MAQLTTADLQGALDALTGHDAGTMSPMKVLQEFHDSATYSRWYIVGDISRVSTPVTIRTERGMWTKTTVASTAANQALEVLAAFQLNSNIDPDAEV